LSKVITTFFLIILISQAIECKKPKLTVAFVIDQFAYHYIDKVRPHLTGGIRDLLKKGVFYTNAYMPHAAPSTSSGHVTLSTGTYPKTHGVVGNKWLNREDKIERYEKLGVKKQYKEFAKPRSSVGLAGKLGRAIWFDYKGRQFTTSKAYFLNFPSWLNLFNQQYLAGKIPEALRWTQFHPKSLDAYNFYDITNYKFASHPFTLINNPLDTIDYRPNDNLHRPLHNGDYSELYIKTPHASQHLLDLASACLDEHLEKKSNDQLLLWISLSPLDPLGHYYGPNSKEAIDMIYHIDWQIKQFMKRVAKKIASKNVLYLLTADHGVMPIPELLQEKGMTNSIRINEPELRKKLNQYIEQKHHVSDVIAHFSTPTFYVNKNIFYRLSKEKKLIIARSIKTFLKKQPGIKEVWTPEELKNLQVEPNSINSFYKNQFYKGRSGEFICKTHPYCAITKHKSGTHHKTPYEYDTHVPLALYHKGKIEKKTIRERVCMTQVANTIAKILEIQKPSASVADPLPGV
jgi:predicted AlkP superfamily pyrophosphatase or phosphodiesterase